VIYVWLICDVSVISSCFGLCIWKVINLYLLFNHWSIKSPSRNYTILFHHWSYETISKKIKNQEVNRLSCPLCYSGRKAVFKFGLSCNQLKNTQNLTITDLAVSVILTHRSAASPLHSYPLFLSLFVFWGVTSLVWLGSIPLLWIVVYATFLANAV